FPFCAFSSANCIFCTTQELFINKVNVFVINYYQHRSVYKICAFLPLLGFLTIFLPDNRQKA
ncbi:hypothetical protein CKQ90_19445, partial [Klebsiella pneumoniae]